MSHEDDDAVIIISRSSFDDLSADKQEKIKAILEKASKEVDKVLKKNPNL